jgi:hypothetical protein
MSTTGLILLGAAILLIVIALHGSAANVCTVITGQPCTSLGTVTVSTSTNANNPIGNVATGGNALHSSGPNYNMSTFYSIHGA